MLIFIYGDNQAESRKKLYELIETYKEKGEILRLDDNASETDFREAVTSDSFFSELRIVTLQNFYKGKSSKWKTEINLKNMEASENVYVFWEDADLNAAGKKAMGFANRKNVFEFKIPNLIWIFLDNIKPEGSSNQIQLFRECLKTVDENYLFLMMVRQFRLLLLSKEKFKDYPSDYKRLTFQKYKLNKQASYFTLEELLKIYKKLLLIEESLKTGKGIYDLKIEIEKLLMNI